MSGRMSRDKGRRAEIELFKALSEELGFVVKRNVDQARNGGADCIELPGYAVEVKRCERPRLQAWWRQAVRQGEAMQAEPITFYRQSRQPWQALLRTADGGYRISSWEEAVMCIREKLARLYGIHGGAHGG